jgi:hypothetical protein
MTGASRIHGFFRNRRGHPYNEMDAQWLGFEKKVAPVKKKFAFCPYMTQASATMGASPSRRGDHV